MKIILSKRHCAFISLALGVCLAFQGIHMACPLLPYQALFCNSSAKAASKAYISTKNITMYAGGKKQIAIKNRKKNASYTYTVSSKKIASVSKKGIITARKKGTVSITVRETLSGRTRKIGTIKLVIKTKNTGRKPDAGAKATELPQATATDAATAVPVSPSYAPPSDTPVPSAAPASATPSPTRMPLIVDDPSTPNGFDAVRNDVTYGSVQKISYYSDTVGTTRHANIILPPGYDESSPVKYPVLYLFHGGNGDENDWLDGKPAQILGNLVDDGLTEDMVIVMPNCRARENDGRNPSDSLSHEHMDAWTNFLYDFKNDLMPFIADNYSVYTDREHTAIAGLSMGGRTALYIGFSIPESVAYIGAFSPAFGIFKYENWGLEEDGYFTEDNFTFPEQYMDTTTCMIMNGSDDTMVRDEPERYHNALVNNNVNHYYYLVPGNHEMNVWKNGLYNFLKIVFR